MRPIKFRAWDKLEKVMYTSESLLFISFDGEVNSMNENGVIIGSHYHRHMIPMQYTGLKDKNGKEIYEGDILLFNNDYPNAQKMDWKCVVKYLKGSFVCEYPKDGVYNHFDSWNVPKVTWEVIGNTYENPELLEGKK